MKTLNTIVKIATALAAVAGAVYVVATYGDQIVAWAKRLMESFPKCPNCNCDCTCAAEDAEFDEAPVEEVPVEEAPAEEVPAEEPQEAPVEEAPAEAPAPAVNEPVAEETDFAE